jgi:hypothetical protein
MPVPGPGRPLQIIAAAVLCLSIVSAGGPAGYGIGSPAQAAATKSADVCGMLSSAQLRPMWGKEMATRHAAELPQTLGCDWGATDGRGGLLTVRVIPSRYYEEPSLARGFKLLPGIADKAYVLPELGGWRAGALKGAKAVVIQVDGGKSNQNTAVTLLKTLVRKI